MHLAYKNTETPKITPSTFEAELKKSSGFKVLVVEDDPADQSLCSVLLRKINPEFVVRFADSGKSALDTVAREEINCVLLDFHLIDGTSDSVVGAMRCLKPWLPILVMSGGGNEEIAVRVMRLGASDYISKDRLTMQALERCMTNAFTKCSLAKSLDQERQELVVANAELRRQRREIESFYHTVSHELKTPMTAIREFNSLLADEILGAINADQKDALETSIDCCDRLTRLVNDLFDTARIETGKLDLNLVQADIQEILHRDVRIMQSLASEKEIALTFRHKTLVPTLLIDPDRISQVICNLIGNGIKYCHRGGRVDVTLAAASDGSQVVVDIEDNGFGISAEHAEFIFDRLFQCGNQSGENTSSENGMGIGLYISRQIIDVHGGELAVASVVGKGSTFTFTLPVVNP